MSHVDPHESSGAYALHALTEDERLDFERHLEWCESCSREVAELQATVALLGRATAVTPPAALREEVLRKVADTPQETRETPGPHEVPGPQEVPLPQADGTARSQARQLPRLALAASVVAVLAAVGVATWQYREAEDARAATQRAQERQDSVARVLTAPDVQVETQELRGGGTATVAVSRSEDAATLAVSGLPQLPADKVYEAWFVEDGTPVPAGLLSRNPGRQLSLLEGSVDDATAVALSVEPAGGSPQPTTVPFGSVDLPA
ncbi:anti-sigma factor domain-containing protein [Streptomyces sp. NBC_00887]|uniref:anti-sigma factor n=1 Tax=Streptomyces sp. NBC_00887 TaxID=2975859 RepID=UPI003862FB4F|nr:anti-sigma factor [Streptomyces sp. NBC_00887]